MIKKVLLAFIIFALAACTQPKEYTAEEVLAMLHEVAAYMEQYTTIQFETGEARIRLPEGWTAECDDGTPVPYTVRSYNIDLIPPPGEKIKGTVTIGILEGGQPLTADAFAGLVASRINTFLPLAVEEEAEYISMTEFVKNGVGIYAVITDAALVGQEIPPNEYLYMAIYYANYQNGCLVYATLLADDIEGDSFLALLHAVAGMELSFETDEPPTAALPPDDFVLPDLVSEPVIIPFETGTAGIPLSDKWIITHEESITLPDTEYSYTVKLTPPPGEKALGILTLGKINGGIPYDLDALSDIVMSDVENRLPFAVEKYPEFFNPPVKDGLACYFMLTNAALVGKEPAAEEYLFTTVFYANYDNGTVAYATLFSDDIYCLVYAELLLSFEFLNISFD